MIGALDKMVLARALAATREGYNLLKLKVGMRGAQDTSKQLRVLVAQLPEGVMLRLDVNQAWDMRQAEDFLAGLDALPIESVEEPYH